MVSVSANGSKIVVQQFDTEVGMDTVCFAVIKLIIFCKLQNTFIFHLSFSSSEL